MRVSRDDGLIRSRSGKRISVTERSGIVVRTPSLSLSLDPKRAPSSEYAFVSHAHIDHVHSPDGGSKIIASRETAALAKARGYDFQSVQESVRGVDLTDAGHILGSRAVLIEDSVFYTGDFSTRDRGFLKGSPGVKCDTLIMETTYGSPKYAFTDTSKIVERVSRVIADCFDKCRPVVLTGYPLGKAQLITYLFRNWEPIFLHESVHKMNEAHIDLGVEIPHHAICLTGANQKAQLRRRPWIMISPASTGRSQFIKSLRENYDAVVIAFTGWAVEPRYKYMMGVDYAFDLSDHCDFNELVSLAKYCDPSKIYTVHGFSTEFAEHLKFLGFDAESLEGAEQSTLTNYA
ncbi:MAG: MBL fold metallo-hydrolase [Thaumarchaeota archaeon]|nr:MBL fold metallo-hydrolase [Nitrososphaerota archaeon]